MAGAILTVRRWLKRAENTPKKKSGVFSADHCVWRGSTVAGHAKRQRHTHDHEKKTNKWRVGELIIKKTWQMIASASRCAEEGALSSMHDYIYERCVVN